MQATEPWNVPSTGLEPAEIIAVGVDDEADAVAGLFVEDELDLVVVLAPVGPSLSDPVAVAGADPCDASDVLKIDEVLMISLALVVDELYPDVVPSSPVLDAVLGGRGAAVTIVLVLVLGWGPSSPPVAQWLPSEVHVKPASQYFPFEQQTPLVGIQLHALLSATSHMLSARSQHCDLPFTTRHFANIACGNTTAGFSDLE